MPGKLLCFDNQKANFHHTMTSLFVKQFGTYLVPADSIAFNLPGPGKAFEYVTKQLNNTLAQFIAQSYDDLETMFKFVNSQSDLSQLLSQLKLTPALTKEQMTKNEFYDGLIKRMNNCMIWCNLLSNAMMRQHTELEKISKSDFHLYNGYWLLLQSIITFNMGVHYSNNLINITEKEKTEKINTCLRKIQEWMQALELDHLPFIKNPEFHKLKKLFFKHLHEFKVELSNHPDFVEILPEELSFALSPEILEVHLEIKNKRAELLGVPYLAQIIRYPASTSFYLPDEDAIEALCDSIKKMIGQPDSSRAQFLFYYNHEFGNVDLIDVQFNKAINQLQIIHVHPANNSAQYFFLQKFIEKLKDFPCKHQILACQADILTGHTALATYPYALSSIVAKLHFDGIRKFMVIQPHFFDAGFPKGRYFEPVEVIWFSFSALTDKSILFMPNLTEMMKKLVEKHGKETGEKKFYHYEKCYDLFEDAKQEEPDSYYIDYRRKRISYQIDNEDPLASLSLTRVKQLTKEQLQDLALPPNDPARKTKLITPKDMLMNENERKAFILKKIKEELAVKDDGQAVRRAAAGFCSMHKFRFLIDTFKDSKELFPPLRAAGGEKGYTPLHWSLKQDHASRAVYLIQEGNLTEMDFTKTNEDKMNALTYFEKAAPHSQVRRNTVLSKLLKK